MGALLDQALSLAAEGFRVFPLFPGTKLPVSRVSWKALASTNPVKIRDMWHGYDSAGAMVEKAYNIGIATGEFRDRYLTVLDVDTKNGGRGLESLDLLDLTAPDDWLRGRRKATTASGGLHYYFVSDDPLGCSASKLGPNLDVKGVGGYVVAPGSIMVDGSVYRDDGGELREISPWLAQEIGRPRERGATLNAECELDSDQAVNRARTWLHTAPTADQGSRGYTAYKVAAALRDYGVSQLTCMELMTPWGETHCFPAIDVEELATSIDNAYTYSQNAIGSKSPEASFSAVDAAEMEAELAEIRALSPTASKSAPVAERNGRGLFYEMFDDVVPDLDTLPLVDEWLDVGSMSVMYGDSNVGKTFVAMSGFGFAIATGDPFAGQFKVQPGVVVYVAAEAGSSARKRVAAMRKHYGRNGVKLALVPCPIDLLRPDGDTNTLIALVRQIEAAEGRVVLVVIDTLSRAMAGGNENGSEDMGAFVRHVDRLRVATKSHVMVVHHCGKDEAKGARGHSLLRAATDTEIELTEGLMTAKKQRDMEKSEPIAFRLQSVTIGTRSDGKEITSAVALFDQEAAQAAIEARNADALQADFAPIKLSKTQAFMVDCLREAIEEHGVQRKHIRAVQGRAWRDRFLDGFDAFRGEAEGANGARVFRARLAELLKKGAVIADRDGFYHLSGELVDLAPPAEAA